MDVQPCDTASNNKLHVKLDSSFREPAFSWKSFFFFFFSISMLEYAVYLCLNWVRGEFVSICWEYWFAGWYIYDQQKLCSRRCNVLSRNVYINISK